MPKLSVITVEWRNDEEVHIYVPDEAVRWAQPVPALRGVTLWRLVEEDMTGDGPKVSFYESADDVFEAVAEQFGLPVVVSKDDR